MADPRPVTEEEAARVMLARNNATTDLKAFAQYVPIPGVPKDDSAADTRYEAVPTQLADHHILMLDTLQAMVDGGLRYVLVGETPHGVASDGGGQRKSNIPPLSRKILANGTDLSRRRKICMERRIANNGIDRIWLSRPAEESFFVR